MSEYIVKCTEVIGISGNALQIPDYIDLNSEIVRCRDCKHFEPRGLNGVCHRSKFLPIYAEPDGYCAWAERRDADNASD